MPYAQSDTPWREALGSTVLVASKALLAKWSSTAGAPADLLAITDDDADQALAVIARRRPRYVVLEHPFAESARGATLVHQLRTNSDLAGVDIRVLSAERSAVLGLSGPVNGRLIASVARSLRCSAAGQVGPTRRARRIRMPAGAEVHLDGASAALINVSTFGVQVMSPAVLKPNGKVEVFIDRAGVELCARAKIAWSSLESSGNALAYRAGLAFLDVQPEILRFESVEAGL